MATWLPGIALPVNSMLLEIADCLTELTSGTANMGDPLVLLSSEIMGMEDGAMFAELDEPLLL